MKKILGMVLALFVASVLVGCSGDDKDKKKDEKKKDEKKSTAVLVIQDRA